MFIAGWMKTYIFSGIHGTRPEIRHLLPDARFYGNKRNINHIHAVGNVYNVQKDSERIIYITKRYTNTCDTYCILFLTGSRNGLVRHTLSQADMEVSIDTTSITCIAHYSQK